ncbi:MAG TPA: DNA polymerase III subunit delta, partial [Verrucomicrobiae bacterium]
MAAAKSPSLALVCGDDDFAVKQRARQLFQEWSAELGGMDHETIEASVSNGGDALKVIGKLREALNTLPFFGGGKVVWLRDCNFLGEDRTASSAAVTETLAELAEELKIFSWQNIRLLISAGKVDKRKVFYKTLDKLGTTEVFSAWSQDDKDWADRAEIAARDALRKRQKDISEAALGELISRAGA